VLNQIVAAVSIVLLSPLLLVIAWMIWRVDGRPVTFEHGRVGHRGRIFSCFKFRSMVLDSETALQELLARDPQARAEWERDHKLSNDPRITPIGRFLRRTSLDELPQLFNILAGDMHFVGPRPVTLDELRRYGAWKRHYLSVKPGLTGLWQVSGRNATTYERRVQLDAHYVERRNPIVDLWIVMRTLKVILTREGAS
jgi:exopolysaccharide production protein ExoY